MPAKTPMYLKTTTPKRGKKLKLRDVLTGDMISPPLGDVRHSAHVGSEGEGDMFGDVGFLHGKMDMLASLNRPQNGQGGRSNSMERCMDDSFASNPLSVHDYSYNGHHYHKSSTGMLKTTISMPVFVTHEQAPPKPPRLHLQDDPAPPSLPSQSHFNHVHHASQLMQPNDHTQNDTGNVHGHNHSNAHKQSSQSNGYNHSHPLFENGMVGRLASDPCRDISFSPTIHRLVPTSGSLSEVSSEDSMSETCGPLDPRRGLSLDSDAGLSNDEDLRSERSDSPCEPAMPLHCFSGPSSPSSSSPASGVTRSDSMTGLNLDLGPSILEDVLGIMDRYKAVDHRCEL